MRIFFSFFSNSGNVPIEKKLIYLKSTVSSGKFVSNTMIKFIKSLLSMKIIKKSAKELGKNHFVASIHDNFLFDERGKIRSLKKAIIVMLKMTMEVICW